jgi:hypothetical protein
MDTRRPEYYAELDAKLRGLLPALRAAFDQETCRWYEEFVRAGEYGLAVETVLDKAVAVDAAPPPNLMRQLLEAADTMGLPGDTIARVREKLGSVG